MGSRHVTGSPALHASNSQGVCGCGVWRRDLSLVRRSPSVYVGPKGRSDECHALLGDICKGAAPMSIVNMGLAFTGEATGAQSRRAETGCSGA